MSTIKNNKLIAVFTGNIDPATNQYYYTDENGDSEWYQLDDLKFHKSYDWLIDVVEEIESLGYFVMITKWSSVYMGDVHNRKSIATSEGGSKIENTYRACVEFIKWYNEQSK